MLDFGNALFRKMRQSSTYLMIVHTAGHTFILPRKQGLSSSKGKEPQLAEGIVWISHCIESRI